MSKYLIWINFSLDILGVINYILYQFLGFKDSETRIPPNNDDVVANKDLTAEFKSAGFNDIVDKYKNLAHAACEYYSLRVKNMLHCDCDK